MTPEKMFMHCEKWEQSSHHKIHSVHSVFLKRLSILCGLTMFYKGSQVTKLMK
jgi:hypothetical protein